MIVAGHLKVEPQERQGYLRGCVAVIEQARRASGCLDFAVSADLIDPRRINIFERWASRADAEAFRGSGPSDDQQAAVLSATMVEYDTCGERSLT